MFFIFFWCLIFVELLIKWVTNYEVFRKMFATTITSFESYFEQNRIIISKIIRIFFKNFTKIVRSFNQDVQIFSKLMKYVKKTKNYNSTTIWTNLAANQYFYLKIFEIVHCFFFITKQIFCFHILNSIFMLFVEMIHATEIIVHFIFILMC